MALVSSRPNVRLPTGSPLIAVEMRFALFKYFGITSSAADAKKPTLSAALLKEKITKASRQKDKPSTYYELSGVYIQIEDLNNVHRPFSKEYYPKDMVVMDARSMPGGCPFYKNPNADPKLKKTSAAETVDIRKRICAEKKELSLKLLSKSHTEILKFTMAKRPSKPKEQDKKPGFCECCLAKYSELETVGEYVGSTMQIHSCSIFNRHNINRLPTRTVTFTTWTYCWANCFVPLPVQSPRRFVRK